MFFQPKHSHPFSISEALTFDTPVIAEEIARLENSLQLLKETQLMLNEDIESSTSPDPDVILAFEENKIVIESQEERIRMLEIALQDRGLRSGHYTSTSPDTHKPAVSATTETVGVRESEPMSEEDNEGLHL
ncbi:hypothetical protein DL96DRAFT_1592914 [Flagelloscypha sp. PMI_526]|nr:hypothetical protein DL96DRAFT_1592914 [Flagelloscypha sp. PMI_526]